MAAVYLDHNASAPVPEELFPESEKLLKQGFANPSSIHEAGRRSRRLISEAAEHAAAFVDCDPEDVYWTSGASESNSWALHSAVQSALEKNPSRVPRLLISAIEHESVQLAAKALAARSDSRAELHSIPVDADGVIRVEALKTRLARDADWDLISVMHVNNETGVIQPIEDVVAAARSHGVPTHVDCVQTLGKIPISLKRLGANYATFSGHKIGAPKGVGFLAIQGEGKRLTALVHGKQQKGLRGGTENPVSVAMFGLVLSEMGKGRLAYPKGLEAWRDEFEAKMRDAIPGAVIHGKRARRLPNTTYVGFEGIDGDGVLMNLDLEGVAASSGSACTSGSVDPSHVLLAMGCDKAMARSSVRFSSGRNTAWPDFEKVLEVLPGIVRRMRGL
ncbi:MAG: cysteine desulfurase [Deltaproteobacteria bacterium]|nr:cysteine desulfurase [Deltaproteobacteria bacterium]